MRYDENNNLCLTHKEYVERFGVEAYKTDKKRDKITVVQRGGNGSEALINYETMPIARKEAIVSKYGDPYQYVVKQPLIEWAAINWNKKAFDFYNKEYTLPNGLKLPEEYRDKYTKAVTYIDAINYYTSDKIALKRDLNINMQSFWAIVADVIKAENVDLPKNEKRLKERIAKYKNAGFKLLIEEFRFCNDNSKKVKDQLAEDMLMKLLALDNKHADEVVACTYNAWASENGRKTITPAAVAYRRRTRYHELIMAREGKTNSYNKYNKQTKRARASSPLMLINSDDNVLDLYFKEVTYSDGRKNTNKYYRPVMYVVIDTYNDYILGYAVGETVTIELIKEAYRNAMNHVIELTGAPYLWEQIQSDKWSIDPKLEGTLATFFKNQATFFSASVAQSKYIERVFGRPLHKVLKVFPNYSGGNITAKSVTSRPNTDALQKRSSEFPDKKHAPAVIEMTINTMRHSIVPGTELTRQQMWLDAFNASEFCAKCAISPERKLELFGIKHENRQKEPARLRVDGLNFQVNNIRYSFDIPASYFPENVNKPVDIYYDPADMTQVLITDHKGIRFVANKYVYQPAAIADMKEGDGKMLHDRRQESINITKKLENYVNDRDARLQRSQIDAHSLLQGHVLTKSINHKAQKTIGGYTEFEEVQTPVQKVIAKEISIYDEM